MLRTEAENAEQVVRSTETRLRSAREQRLTLKGRLEAVGQEGLAEKREGEAIALGRAEWDEAALLRRAHAARLLFETLRTHRDAARRGYMQPLTQEIERLGRYVFDETLTVEFSDDLRIANRTLQGRTVPFDSLSGGAREQLSMLTRIACAQVVAEDGGVPLVFDDALGNSDAARLEKLGVVLGLAGKTCQVLVLTCAPERYRNVGGLKEVQLTPGMTEPADG